MAIGISDNVKQLLLRVDAQTELAKRSLDDLARAVQVDAAKMDASLGKVDGALGRLQGSFGKLNGLAGGLLAGIGVGVIANLGRDILKFADDLETAANQAGIAVERYQTLSQAFRTLEIDTEQTDKILKTLQSTLGDVQNQTDNSATKAIERLGITADVMSGKITTSDQLLDALAGSASKAGTQAQFTADIVDIFGKKVGVDLAAAIADGGKALHDLEDGIRSAGGVIDSDLIAKLADANEAIDKFTHDAKVQLTVFVGEVLDIFGSLSTAFDVVTGGWESSIGSFTSRGLYDIRNFARDVDNLVAGALGALDKVSNFERRIDNAASRGIDAITPDWLIKPGLQMPLSDRAGSFRRRRTMDQIFSPQSFDKLFGEPAASGGNAIQARPSGGARRRSGGGGGARRRTGGGRATKPVMSDADLRDKANFDAGAFDPIIDTKVVKELRESQQFFERMVMSADELQSTLNSFTLPDFGAMLSPEDEKRLNGFVSTFNNDIAAGLAEAIVYGENLGDVLENTFKRAAAAMIQSGILNFLTGGKEGTSFGTMFANIGKIFGGKFADGGSPPVGKISLVGEKGPELFMPRVPGRIIPNHALGGGGGVSLTVHAPGATAETVMMIRRELANAAPALVAASTSQTLRTLRRPGL